MRPESPKSSARIACLLTAFGLLAPLPGCGDAPKKATPAEPIPATVKESNNNMENFMKSQGAAKK